MRKKDQIAILVHMNSTLSSLSEYMNVSGTWKSNQDLFVQLGELVYGIQESLEELTGESYIDDSGDF